VAEGHEVARRGSRLVAVTLAAMIGLWVSGCAGTSAEWRTATEIAPSPTPSATATPTATTPPPSVAPDKLVMSVDGIGPYKLGVSTAPALVAAGQLTPPDPYYPEVCTGIATALGTQEYSGRFTLYFKDDLLVAIVTAAPDVTSPSGAHVGLPASEIERIYKTRVVASDGYGGTKIYTVTVDDRKLILHTDTSTTITTMFVQKGVEPVLTPHDGPAC
jgi:hypothetical protein